MEVDGPFGEIGDWTDQFFKSPSDSPTADSELFPLSTSPSRRSWWDFDIEGSSGTSEPSEPELQHDPASRRPSVEGPSVEACIRSICSGVEEFSANAGPSVEACFHSIADSSVLQWEQTAASAEACIGGIFSMITESSSQLEQVVACGKRKGESPKAAFAPPLAGGAQEFFRALTQNKRGRGEHVKGNPDAQQTGRNGQAEWAKRLQEVTAEWERHGVGEQFEVFKEQLEMRRVCNGKRMFTRARLACLVRKLQLCCLSGEIQPDPFSTDEEHSFLGWTGFQVTPGRGAEFRRSIISMFPAWGKMDDKTLNDILRDANLMPACSSWPEAWNGQPGCRFVFHVPVGK